MTQRVKAIQVPYTIIRDMSVTLLHMQDGLAIATGALARSHADDTRRGLEHTLRASQQMSAFLGALVQEIPEQGPRHHDDDKEESE